MKVGHIHCFLQAYKIARHTYCQLLQHFFCKIKYETSDRLCLPE